MKTKKEYMAAYIELLQQQNEHLKQELRNAFQQAEEDRISYEMAHRQILKEVHGE